MLTILCSTLRERSRTGLGALGMELPTTCSPASPVGYRSVRRKPSTEIPPQTSKQTTRQGLSAATAPFTFMIPVDLCAPLRARRGGLK